MRPTIREPSGVTAVSLLIYRASEELECAFAGRQVFREDRKTPPSAISCRLSTILALDACHVYRFPRGRDRRSPGGPRGPVRSGDLDRRLNEIDLAPAPHSRVLTPPDDAQTFQLEAMLGARPLVRRHETTRSSRGRFDPLRRRYPVQTALCNSSARRGRQVDRGLPSILELGTRSRPPGPRTSPRQPRSSLPDLSAVGSCRASPPRIARSGTTSTPRTRSACASPRLGDPSATTAAHRSVRKVLDRPSRRDRVAVDRALIVDTGSAIASRDLDRSTADDGGRSSWSSSTRRSSSSTTGERSDRRRSRAPRERAFSMNLARRQARSLKKNCD